MTLRYNLTGADRKRLVNAISEITGVPAKYLGAPSFAYQVDYFTIDRNGGVTFDDRADSEETSSKRWTAKASPPNRKRSRHPRMRNRPPPK